MRRFCLLLLSFYQSTLSLFFGGACRFEPSCSEYARQAFQTRPFLAAFSLTLRRLLRCRPGGNFGLDPVPCVSHSSGVHHE